MEKNFSGKSETFSAADVYYVCKGTEKTE